MIQIKVDQSFLILIMKNIFRTLAVIILLCAPTIFARAIEAGKSIGTVEVTCIDHSVDPFGQFPETWEYKYTGSGYDLLFYRTGTADWVKCRLDLMKSNDNLVFPDYILHGSTKLRVKQIQIVEPANYVSDADGAEHFYLALSQTIPETVDDVWYGPDYVFRGLPMYFLGDFPFIHHEYGDDHFCLLETFPNSYLPEIYVARKSAYEEFKRYAALDVHRCRAIPFGWDFPVLEIDLANGSIEQHCNTNGWKEIYNLKIKGHMTDADISFIKNNRQLRKLDLSGTDMTEIPDGWFWGDNDFTHYTTEILLPPTVRRIGANAFHICSYLELCSGFKGNEIGDHAFSSCPHLSDFDFSTLEKLGEAAFSGTSLEKAVMPRLTEVGRAAFEGCSNLKYADISAATSIGYAAFINTPLQEVKFSNNLESMEASVFKNTALTDVVIPETVKIIGIRAFEGCEELKSIRFPKELKVIPKYICHGCRSLENVVLPESVIEIGYTRLPGEIIVDGRSFSACENLTHIDFPESLLYIGPYAFASTGLEEVRLPEKVRVLDLSCFSGTPITEIVIPDAVNYIFKAFKGCQSLKKAVIGKSLSTIGGFVSSGIETVEFADGAAPVEISSSGFYDCASLREFTIPASIRVLWSECFSYSGLESINIPPAVEKIESKAFAACRQLAEVTLPYTFAPAYSSGYRNADETPIAPDTFAWCTALRDIYSNADVPPVLDKASFDNIDKSSVTLHVPLGCADDYRAHQYWREFANIVEDGTLGVEPVIAPEESVRYYDLRGLPVDKPASPGLYIEVRGGRAKKVAL